MKLLGLKVTRNTGTAKESSHEVWVGPTGEDLAARKKFIVENCYSEEFDGVLTFDRIESDVVVDGPGLYLADGAKLGFRVQMIEGHECFGYYQRETPRGRVKDGRVGWFNTNGLPITSSTHKLTGRAPC